MASKGPSMGISRVAMPRFAARARASSVEASEVKREGISTPRTFSGPRASAARQATRAESMPPERPRTAREKPVLWK